MSSGASEVKKHVLDQIPTPNLWAYVVWQPVLLWRARESAARRAERRIFDQRVTHFWDARTELGKLYSEILNLPGGIPAWDVYFILGLEVRWEDKPPTPTYWMHQLGKAGPSELRLDGEKFARVVNGLLVTTGTGWGPSTWVLPCEAGRLIDISGTGGFLPRLPVAPSVAQGPLSDPAAFQTHGRTARRILSAAGLKSEPCAEITDCGCYSGHGIPCPYKREDTGSPPHDWTDTRRGERSV